MIQLYTGNGKGKTTAAIGLTIRALSNNKKVCIIQFFKSEKFYGEQRILKHLKNLKLWSFAKKHPHFYKNVKTKDITDDCEKALILIEKILLEKKCDLLILDELSIVVNECFIELDRVVNILKKVPKKIEVVITGRDAPKEILAISDLVTDMQLVKHPYYSGAKARKGIEY